MENNILYNLFITDFKSLDIPDIAVCNNSIERMLKRYSLGIGDYENNKLTEALFFRMGWSNRFKDTLFSFRNILYSSIEYFSNPQNDITFRITLDDGAEVRFYNKNILKYTINGKYNEKYCYSKKTLWEKYQSETCSFHKAMSNISNDIVDSLKIMAELSDSIANFMPHPGFPFNQAKGRLEDVADSLNLMVDKIQDCIDKKEDLKYDSSYKPVKLERLKEWKNWFIDNQKIYCLEDFYYVEEGKIIGKKLFEGQGLYHPYPTNTKELKDCLSEMICRLYKRAKDMSISVH